LFTKSKTLWLDKEMNHENGKEMMGKLFGKTPFDFPKSVDYVQKCLQLGTFNYESQIVLDFFSGSATTAQAVMQLNAEDGGKRRFIMVQLPELTDEKSEAFKAGYKNICEIGKERIRRAGRKIKEQNADVDVGFKVLKLDTSNLIKWDDTPVKDTDVLRERFDTMIKTLKFDRGELDVVYEVMLKLGIEPTAKVSEENIGGRKVWAIGKDDIVLVCLDGSGNGVTPDDVASFCALAPKKIVFAEEAFKDDVVLSNAYYICQDNGIEADLL
ncbi:MAG: site-specific DNA-methyltransferase, partial [Alphaproteobacteria bacterium]|nr:site-specific DNA-methyltransferase [Alphaproteobacteria bacterium]